SRACYAGAISVKPRPMKKSGLLAFALLIACGSHKNTPAPAPAPVPGPAPAPGPSPEPEAKKEPTPAPSPAAKSLYERLGGEKATTAVVEEFVARTTTDARIKDRFFNVDADNLKHLLVEFVCMATGGPCKYEGRDMATAHAGMDLVDEE